MSCAWRSQPPFLQSCLSSQHYQVTTASKLVTSDLVRQPGNCLLGGLSILATITIEEGLHGCLRSDSRQVASAGMLVERVGVALRMSSRAEGLIEPVRQAELALGYILLNNSTLVICLYSKLPLVTLDSADSLARSWQNVDCSPCTTSGFLEDLMSCFLTWDHCISASASG